MTINLVGTMTGQDTAKLHNYLGYSHEPGDPGWERFGPLSFNRRQPSLCGINAWPSPTMDAVGNLAERGYDVEDVANHLRELVQIAGSMLLKVHCGGDYESLDCIATVSVGEGVVAVGKPEIEQLKPLSDAQAELNLIRALTAPRY